MGYKIYSAFDRLHLVGDGEHDGTVCNVHMNELLNLPDRSEQAIASYCDGQFLLAHGERLFSASKIESSDQ